MIETAHGSVEIHNAYLVFFRNKCINKLYCDEFPKGVTGAKFAVDPKDYRKLQKEQRRKKEKGTTEKLTVRVLKQWFDQRMLCFEALEKGGTTLVPSRKPGIQPKDNRVKATMGRSGVPWTGVSKSYMKGKSG